jgi:microcystin-dependent protein
VRDWVIAVRPLAERIVFQLIIFLLNQFTAMDVFIGMIGLFGFNFAPKGWATCNGQILSISQNTALFSLIGTTYGGNGQTTFALPDLRGRVPLGQGQGPGLSNYEMGQVSGSENVTLIQPQMPMHNHMMMASPQAGSTNSPNGSFLAVSAGTVDNLGEPVTVNTYGSSGGATLNPQAISIAGGNQPHPNMQPYLGMNYCIALFGIFPSRN